MNVGWMHFDDWGNEPSQFPHSSWPSVNCERIAQHFLSTTLPGVSPSSCVCLWKDMGRDCKASPRCTAFWWGPQFPAMCVSAVPPGILRFSPSEVDGKMETSGRYRTGGCLWRESFAGTVWWYLSSSRPSFRGPPIQLQYSTTMQQH
jgi:hypothetical protein